MFLLYVYWNLLSDKICSYFTDVDVIYYCSRTLCEHLKPKSISHTCIVKRADWYVSILGAFFVAIRTFCCVTKYNDNPLPIRLYTNLFEWTLLLLNYDRFPKNIWDGCSMLTGDAYISGHLVPWLAYALLVETNLFFELIVIVPDYAIRMSLSNFSILHSTVV